MGTNDRGQINLNQTNSKDYQQDLPAPRVDDHELPIPVAGLNPEHEPASLRMYPEWSNLASQRYVTSLALDSKRGDLWLATAGGVLRWQPDFRRYTRYTSEHGLRGNFISAIAADRTGRAWAVHKTGGISYFEDSLWHLYPLLNNTDIPDLAVDKIGRLWIATEKEICCIENIHEGPCLTLPSPGTFIRKMDIKDENDIWLCNALGLLHFNGDVWTRRFDYTHPGILTLARQEDRLWLGMMDGLHQMDLSSSEIRRSEDWPVGEVTALSSDHSSIWVACNSQVGRIDDTGWHMLTNPSDQAQVIRGLVQSEDNGVWIATHNGLMHGRSEGLRFHLTDTPPDVFGSSISGRPPGTFSNMVQSLKIQETEKGRILWIGTARDLFHMDLHTQVWRRYTVHGLQDIRALAFGKNSQEIWAGTWMGGVYDIKDRIFFKDIPGPILALAQGRDNIRWAAGLDGLFQWNGSEWITVQTTGKIPGEGWIQSLLQTEPGKLWLGTSAGLFAYAPGSDTFTRTRGELGQADTRALTAFESDLQNPWVGTSQGLYWGAPEVAEPVSDLENTEITALACDHKNRVLWVGAKHGLYHMAQHQGEWRIVEKFTVENSGIGSDHITALETDHTSEGASNLWIGTPCGLSCYRFPDNNFTAFSGNDLQNRLQLQVGTVGTV